MENSQLVTPAWMIVEMPSCFHGVTSIASSKKTTSGVAVKRRRRMCQHCRKRPATRPRILCYTCYRKEEIRAMYPPETIRGEWGANQEADHYGQAAGPAEQPTPAKPGSEEKILVMTKRESADQSLYHPLDGRLEDERAVIGKSILEQLVGGNDDLGDADE